MGICQVPQMSLRVSILTKGQTEPPQNCKDGQFEGLTVFDRWCHDIATSRLTKNSEDLENAILRHEKSCLEEQRIRSGSVYSLSKQCREQERGNGESGSCCDYTISGQT